jgi:Carboxypeptidase regulatory-like domain
MITRSALLRSVVSGAFLLAGSWALAQTTGTHFISGPSSPTAQRPQTPQLQSRSVQVDVKGLDAKPVNGAEVRIETAKAGALSVKTDQKGRYVFKDLAVGLYRVTALVNKVPTSPANVTALSEGPVRVEFNLQAIAAGKKPKQWAWIVAEGSHIGGRWVEVDERTAAGLDRAATLGRATGHRGNTQPNNLFNERAGGR